MPDGPPEVSASDRLRLELEEDAASPLRVISAAPEGAVGDPRVQIHVAFSKPMRGLSLAEDEVMPAIRVEPHIAGSWSWIGTNALVFDPAEGAVRSATAYTVTVPKGVVSLDGNALEQPHELSFETPRPEVLGIEPIDSPHGVRPVTEFLLQTSLPVSPKALAQALRVESRPRPEEGQQPTRPRDGIPVPVDVERSEDPGRLSVRPRTPLPLDSVIEFVVSDALVSEAGPLPSGREFRQAVETYAPLSARLECDSHLTACSGRPWLVFSNPVDARSLRGRVRVFPDAGQVLRLAALEEDPLGTTHVLHGRYLPEKAYRVTLSSGIRDVFGQELTQDVEFGFQLGAPPQLMALGATGTFIEPGLGDRVTISSVNVEAFELLSRALSRDDVVRLWASEDASNYEKIFPDIERRWVRPRARFNRQHDETLSFQSIVGERRGAMLLGYSFEAEHSDTSQTEIAMLHATDLGVTPLVSAHGGLVWVTSLTNGRPVPNARVRFANLPGASDRTYATDASGVALVPEADIERASDARTGQSLVLAETDSDWAYAPAPTVSAYSYASLGSVLTDRGIYRPGETIFVKGWLRQENATGTEPVPDVSVKLELTRDDTELDTVEATTNEYGGFDAVLRIPSYTALGEHVIAISGGGFLGRKWVRVGEYRSSEFSSEVTLTESAVTRGATIVAHVHGEYLFGGAMAGAVVEAWSSPTRGSFQPPNSEGFTTEAWDFAEPLRRLFASAKDGGSTTEALLDETGSRKFEFSSKVTAFGPVRYEVFATVEDASRQAVSATGSALVHPGAHYVGVRLAKDRVPTNAELRPEVIAVTADGKRLSGERVTVALYDAPYSDSQPPSVPEKTSECRLTTGAAAVSCPLLARQPGPHFVLVRSEDAAKNPLYAATPVFVGQRFRGHFDTSKVEELDVQTDKESYRTGEVAQVLVRTPHADVDVLLTVEQRGIHFQQKKRATGHSATFEVPVTKEIARNATLVARVARGPVPERPEPGLESTRPDGSAPVLETAYGRLDVEQSHKRLAVKVTPEREIVEPGGSVMVRLDVADPSGAPQPGEVTLMAVDEGVLMLTNHETPDPWPDFIPHRDNVVEWSDSRELSGFLFRPELEESARMGFGYGSARLGGSHKARAPQIRMGSTRVTRSNREARADFTTTPYFNPGIIVGESGHVEVEIRLSELLTSYRLMAVVSGKGDHFGRGEAAVQTRLPLMVRPAMPRFARQGDAFAAGVLISSSTVQSDDVTVSLRAIGVRSTGKTSKKLSIRPGSTTEVRFDFVADTPGTAELEFRVEAPGFRDAVKSTLPIQVPLSPQAVALYGKTEGARGERIENLGAASPHYGELDVAMASTALVGLDEGIEQLFGYPYGCTEQLSSRLLPQLPLRDLANDFGIPMPDDIDETVKRTVSEILTRQRHDGGFGLWPGDPESHPWLSAYVLDVLLEAKARGVSIPDEPIDRALAYLGEFINHGESTYRPTIAFIANVLAAHGRPSRLLSERLMKNGEDDPSFVRALTLETLVRVRREPEKTELNPERVSSWARRLDEHIARLTRSLESKIRLSANRASIDVRGEERYDQLFDSKNRTQALVLRALLEANPKHPLAEPLARGLLEARRGGTWRSTQETAYALLALDSYRTKQERAIPDFEAAVWLGERRLGTSEHRGRSLRAKGFSMPMSALPRDGSLLAFQKQGEGTLFYQALIRYSPNVLPLVPLDHGFFVESKLYLATRGETPRAIEHGYAPPATRFSAGDVVQGDVTVIVPVERSFVVIEVPLPAGLEPIDTTFGTEQHSGYVDEDAGAFASAWFRRELRDDRVLYFLNSMSPGSHRFRYLARATTTGTFVTPPARASEMYSPENFGRTGATRVLVE